MKTFLVVAESKVDDHAGEQYDDILEVEDQPTTETIREWADRIRNRIRKLWHEDKDGGDDESAVAVTLDGPSPYNAMLINLQILMQKEENIAVELPYLDSTIPITTDPEALAMISRLDGRQGE